MLFFLGLFMITSCDKDKDESSSVDIEMNFKVEYDGEPLVMFNEYTYPSGERLTFSRFSFYLSNVALNHTEGQDQLMDVKYLDFTVQNSSLEGANEGITLMFNELEEKNYDKLFFSIGVSQASNALTPADFSSSSDLSKDAEYWGPWGSYIFTRTEGQIDFGQPQMSQFSLHTGSDEARLDLLIDLSNMVKGEDGTISLVIDLKDYFEGDTIYDIKSNPQLHQLSQKPQVLELTNNLSNAIKVSVN